MTRSRTASTVKRPARNKQRPKRNKQQAARRAARERQALENLGEKRRPFEPLLKQIIAAVLHAEPPTASASSPAHVGADGPLREESWIEIGSGLGQLRSLLPSEVRGRVIHTELSASLVRALLQKHPDARALPADVSQLPFETASVDVVLGLCVFDEFSSPAEASREIGRVLRGGGRFVHFLDAATNVERLFIELIDDGRLPLPNFFPDIALRQPTLLDETHAERFIQPYHDMLSVPLQQYRAIMEVLQRVQHPLAPMLLRYSAPFVTRPFEPLAAARAFVRLTSDPAIGRPMNQALMSLFTTLQQPPYSEHMPFHLQSHSSLAHFKASVEHYFGCDFGFELRLSDIVYARTYELDEDSPLRARVRRVGIGQNCVDWPVPEGIPAHHLKPDLPGAEVAGVAPSSHVLREAAVYCFVAEKKHTG